MTKSRSVVGEPPCLFQSLGLCMSPRLVVKLVLIQPPSTVYTYTYLQ